MSSNAKRKHSEIANLDDERPEPSKRLAAACTACRRQKIKCDMINEEPPCSRCQRRGITCVLHTAVRHPMADAKQVGLMGKDLANIHATLEKICQHLNLELPRPLATEQQSESGARATAKAGEENDDPEDTCELSPPASPSTAHAPMDMYLTSTQEPSLGVNSPRRLRRRGSERVDMISKGLISLEDAETLVQKYLEHLDPFVYGITGGYKDATHVRRASPALLAAMCTVAAFHDPTNKHLFEICNREYRSIISSSLFEKRDLKFVEALCIGAFWLPDASRILLNDAIRRAKDLKLHRNFLRLTEPALLAATSPGSVVDITEIRDRVRLWYLLYICDQHLSILHNRDRILRQEKEAVENRELFIAGGEPVTAQDVRVMSQVCLLVIMGQVRDVFGSESIKPVSRTLTVQLAHFARELDAWYARWSSIFEPDKHIGSFPLSGLTLHWQFAKLYLGHHVFRGIENDPIPTHFLTAATTARDAAITIFTMIAEDESFRNHLNGMPIYFHVMISFAGQFLMGICLKYGQQLGIDVEGEFRRISAALAVFARTPALPSHPISRMTAGLTRKLNECAAALGITSILTESPFAQNQDLLASRADLAAANANGNNIHSTVFDLQAANGLPEDFLYAGFGDMTFPDTQFHYTT
ncbi:hypothetical protein CKM354_000517200 [Cercospora kikuchii]|uniref:Zn(2)-C6 fungal-type domain-containing protein n=1 Tax=Cercospora kikuchii TaxID=84275 RepID=A0A9P3FC70_9PEZI|nr:uncharacterized protein CKM354_000517200 [Cercospora kikuchii]GIZ41883.1 hypothetical protein CKM354_000517200 [Cercospora kikuchii]